MSKKILFIHHSTGGLLLRFGHIRKLLREKTPHLELWDHAYNLYPVHMLSWFLGPLTFRTGLSDSNGKMTGRDFNIVISNNSPKEYTDIFSRNPSDGTLKQILDFDVVIFKNCFPTSKISSDQQLNEYKSLYKSIFRNLATYPNLFVVFTQPPLRQEVTNLDEAARARNLTTWMKSSEAGISKNISVFNFFDLLADDTGMNQNMLKRDCCTIIPIDSHPNIRANRKIGVEFTNHIIKVVNAGGW